MSDEEAAVAPQPEQPPVRRRRTVRRRGGYMATGSVATAMGVPPTSVTISDHPAALAPEAQDADDEQGADG